MFETREYVIKGIPIPQKRARFGKGRVYDSQKEIKEACRLELARQHEGDIIFYPIHASFVFYIPIPESYSSKTKKALIDSPHHRRPDLDNICKWYMDAMTSVVYLDDCLITTLTASKFWTLSSEARTEIQLFSTIC